MTRQVTNAIAILDFVLIYLTALSFFLSLRSSVSWFEIVYNMLYVVLNITTLLLNLWIFYKQAKQ